jgi:hypothetical protein
MPFRFRLTLKAPNVGQDNFFLWSMVILPIVAESAYIFDAYYYLFDYSSTHSYKGLLSTILVVFTYLRYCAPIESTRILGIYYIILCILNEIGTSGYLVIYIQHKATFNIVIYVGWALLEIMMTILLIYYRVINHCHPNFHVESKHLFHFISRLEVILAIFIPFFFNNISITLTKNSIAFFLLFDFFSESYCLFQGFWIKSTLYLFVCTVTVCVGSEWVFLNEQRHIYEIVSSSFELISACLCDILIILQFIPYHFKPIGISKIAREALIFQQNLRTDSEANVMDFQTIETNSQTIEIISEPTLTTEISEDSVINIVL